MNFLKLIKIIIFIYLFSLNFDFGNSYKQKINQISNFKTISPKYISINSISLKCPENFENKFRSFLKLIRANNIPATIFLCFSGGFIMNPGVSLFKNHQFWLSTLITNFIMSANMAINDLFDMEVDRINSPNRPLITGEISKKEAIGYTVGLLGLTELCNIWFLPMRSQNIIHLAVGFTLIYTPILKRILFLKNLSCATIVAFSLFFTGVSSFDHQSLISLKYILQIPRFSILKTAISLIFCGSFTNEILLDIRDSEGDIKQGIRTISNTFGKIPAFYIVYMTWYLFIIGNTLRIINSQNIVVGGILCTILYQQLIYLYWVYRKQISNKAIQIYLKQSNRTMISMLLYLCFLSIRL
jgi:4-hydroxybenzoate polyprenyltransferase